MKKTIITLITLMTLTAVTLLLSACSDSGGGSTSNSATPTQVKVTLKTTGTLPVNDGISGIGVTVSLPPGVVPLITGGGDVDPSVIVPSGVAANAADILPHYIGATENTPGKLSFVIVSNADKGFVAGDFVTLNLTVSNGGTVTAGDFKITDFQPADLQAKPLPTGVGGLQASLALSP